jgi:hypothetical protein
MTKNNRSHNTPATDSGYEKKDINLNKLLVGGVIAVVTVIIVVVFILDYYTALKEEIVYEQELRPESKALRELRARENEELNGYFLLDQEKERYRIPIERAMQLMADEAFKNSN